MIIENSINSITEYASKELSRRAKNLVLTSNDDYLVMLVVGPNQRTDFHRNFTDVRGISE